MAEVLATVAIILILASIVVMNVVSFQATLRQKALDAKAEIIYTAAQEQMTRIMASGREGMFAAPSQDNVTGGTFSGTADGSVNTDRTTAGVSFIPAINAIPGDATEDSPVEKWQTCYITSADVNTAGTAANLLFGNGGLDDELLNNHWVIEFDYKSLTVHAVYYSEDYDCTDANDTGYSNTNCFPYYNANLRNHALRLSSEGYLGNGKHVGYHGGGSSSTNISFDLDPSIQVSNTEKLTATIKCSRPLIVEDLAFIVTLEDSFGHSQKAVYCMLSDEGELKTEYPAIPVHASDLSTSKADLNAVFKKEGLLYTLELTLDSLEGDGSLRFTKLYGSGSQSTLTGSNAALVEGSDIGIKVQVVCKKNPLVETGYAGYSTPVVVNSLFDDDTVVGDDSYATKAGVAGISYGRHLQNLDDGSGVQDSAANISSAEQHADIDFSSNISEDTDNRGWASTYGKLCFEPISNNKLVSYEGKPATAAAPYSIAHLNVNETGTRPAGLFSSIATGTSENPVVLNNVVLTGSTVKGTGSVGGLVGAVSNSGALRISNCQLFLSPSEDITPTTDEKTAWLEGYSVGGLVGINSGGLQISNSSASTVAHGGTVDTDGVAGGLVGINSNSDSDSLKITASYADSYLTASKTGGLVGSGKATVTSSYSAGYLGGTSSSSTAAGLVNGGGRIEDSYTACTTYGESKLAHYYCASASGDHDNVRYLTTAINATTANENTKGLEHFTDEDSATDLRNSLNGSSGTTFTLEQQSKTYPYNLMDQGLSSYAWPTINNLYHYGDWPAGFQAGTLVYFEKYQIGTGSSKRYCYGFEGANVSSTLINASKLESGKTQWVLDGNGFTALPGSGQDIIVVGDGYGVVYGSDVTPPNTEVSVLMPKQGKSRSDWDVIATQTIGSGDNPYEVKASNGSSYKIYPLRAKGTESNLATASITNTTAVNGSSFYLGVNLGSDTYFFNPHFAKTVHKAGANEAPEAPSTKDYIYLRTGRQLHNLSLYYTRSGGQSYRGVTKGCTFAQQRDIAFTDYAWTDFTSFGKITSQAPIGVDAAQSFNATYDGGRFMITDVSFVTADNDYVGMFGYVGTDATIKNVVLCTDYTPASSNAGSSSGAQADMARNYYVQRTGAVSANDVVNMGVLAGYNAGTITNCATAGYYLAGADGTVHAYANSTVNIGGMVGTNAGSITNSAADSPKLRLSLFESTTNAAGFVGANTTDGAIKNCYALGAIDVADAKGGRASISGFAGLNQGVVDSSYCATAIASSGDGTKSYGFAPAGGRVTNCEYLNGGTYSYVNRMYPYNFNTNKNYTSGSPIRYGDLKSQRTGAEVDEAHSFVHSQTQSETGNNAYPYRGVVRDASNAYVHYGNWQDDVVLGTLGIFYWEHEEHGSNDGYHMTYLGSTEKQEKGTWVADVKGGTSLCTSHDDGGVITEYGYGVYTQSGQEGYTTISWKDINCSSEETTGNLAATKLSTANYNVAASDALADQMENTDTSDREYSFFAFTTRTGTDDYLYLDGGTGAGAKQNGTLTLSFKNTDNNGTGATEAEYTYTVSPFFANAMSIDNIEIDGSNSAATLPGAVNVEASDGSVTDYRTPVGTVVKNTEGEVTKSNQYETRSLQQLQYINWNDSADDTSTLVNDGNMDEYPYLLYAKITDTNTEQVTNIDAIVSADVKDRASLYWLQTHDLQRDGDSFFDPIAGTSVSSTQTGGYSSYLCAWFGSYYDGQSYTIKNVRISSDSFHVGLFGTTVGAKLKNIIMRGDGTDNSMIERANREGGTDVGAYALGGLVGVAYDYNVKDLSNLQTIENCAISGYTVKDSSTNVLGLGEVNVGGLVGVCNTKMSRCESTADIVLNAAHKEAAKWGVFIRVGGIAGACQAEVVDSYSGGSCTIGSAAIASTPSCTYWGSTGSVTSDAYQIYIGGIVGSGFTSNFRNFTGDSSIKDGSPTVKNCYTYFAFPDTSSFTNGHGERELNMYAVASVADRKGQANIKNATITNCYYINTIPSAVSAVYPTDGSKTTSTNLLSRSYSEMSDPSFINTLNSGNTGNPWLAVTTKDFANVPIDGKFSYPTSPALEGKNYPFPTVITQNDLTFGSVDNPKMVHVHYGDWPIDGSYWENGRDTMDIFSDMSDGGWAYKEFTLHVDRTKFKGDVDQVKEKLSVEDGSYASIESVSPTDDSDVFKVKIRAKREGTTKICFNGEASATFTLQITANWKLSAGATDDTTAFDSSSNTLRLSSGVNTPAAVRLFAHDASGAKEYSTAASIKWDDPAPAADVDNTLVLKVTDKNKLTVNRVANGSVVVTVTATYNYHDSLVDSGGQTFTQQLFINVEMPSTVGLSNNLAHKSNIAPTVTFNEVQLGGESHDGVNVSYPDAQTKPSPSYAENNFFLYTKDGDTYLENAANVKSVAVKEQGSSDDAVLLTPGVYDASKGFYVELNDAVTADGHFAYLGGTLFYTTSTPPGSPSELLEITVTLQGDYRVTTTIPTGWLEQKNAHTVTLQRGDDTKTTRSFVIVDGTAYLKGYDAAVFAKAGWELDGWYTKLNGTTKVLDAAGKVCANVSGYTANGFFELSRDVTLYAKWKKAKTVWVPATTILDGERYVIVDSKTAGQAHVAYQAEDGEKALDYWSSPYNREERGIYLKDEPVTISSGSLPAFSAGTNGTYIENSFEDPEKGYVWKAVEYPSIDYCVLENENYPSFFLADNNCLSSYYGPWAVVSTDANRLFQSDSARKCAQVDADSRLLFSLNQTSRVRFNSGTSYVLAMDEPQNAPYAYLFQETTYFEYTSTYESKITLTLMNGSEKVANDKGVVDVPVAAPIVSSISYLGFTGTQLPASTNGWELLGWYDNATYSDATKVLEPGGSVVGGKITGKSKYEVKDNTLTLKESLTLYAIWRHTITNAYVEVSSPPTSLSSTKTYLIASGDNKFLAVDRDSGALTAVTLNPESGDYYSGTTLLNTGVIITEGNAAWKVSASDDFTLKNVLKEKYLGANDIDNYLSNSSLSMGDTQKQWNYSSGQISTTVRSRYGWELTRYLAYANGNWVGTSSGGALTFYEQQDVYIITPNKS